LARYSPAYRKPWNMDFEHEPAAADDRASDADTEITDIDVLALRKTLNLQRGGSILLVGEPSGRVRAVTMELAKAVVCVTMPLATGKNACGQCPACRKVQDKQHPDVLWVEPRGSGSAVKIEDIRLLKERISLKPYEARRKVSIVVEAERLTVEAANALLKILEEPPADSVIILTAASTEQLLATVVSRCTLGRISSPDFRDAAEGEDISRWIAEWFDVTSAAQETALADGLGKLERRSLEFFLRELVFVYRDAAILSRIGSDALTTLSRQPQPLLMGWATVLGPAAAAAPVEEIMRLEEFIRGNVNVKLAVDALLTLLPWRMQRRNAGESLARQA